MIESKENWFVRLLKRLGILTERKVDKHEMCKSAQSICNHDCQHCAWNEGTEI